MLLHFYLHYSTEFGQSIFVSGNHPFLGNRDTAKAFPLQYLNDQLWHGFVEIDPIPEKSPIQYNYIIRNTGAEEVVEFGDDRIIDVAHIKAEKVILLDTWNYSGEFENAFFTNPFRDVLLKNSNSKTSIIKSLKNYTHEFKVKAPLLKENETLCIGGSAKQFKNWDTEKTLPLIRSGNWFTLRLNLSKEKFPLTYKYGIYDLQHKKFIKFEDGNNRILLIEPGKHTQTIIHDGFANLQNINWKGAGVAIPVFSLRRRNGFGTGEFTDIKLLADWAKASGIKLIQLLPVNDTTNTHQDKDSYPYSAISAFALHPMYLNIEELAGEDGDFISTLAEKKKQLDDDKVLNYETVMQVKIKAIEALYQLQKNDFLNDIKYVEFFELNRHWLVPYAAFSFLRDKYGTADFTTWNTHSIYNKEEIQELVSSKKEQYEKIAIHYFTQYHLHLQLRSSTDHAHKKGVVIKGDIPIGICRHSVDAWIDPALYNMHEQAGAPPDAFTGKGQNWGFPTYNWAKMQLDNFAWWGSRFKQMAEYFDAFRIDHILGFFRIWSIPVEEAVGVMGRFVPATPVSINELFQKRISYDSYRYTKPFVNDKILRDLFGKKTATVKKRFFSGNEFKEAFNTQRKLEAWFTKQKDLNEEIKQGLLDLLSNVILFEEKNSQGQKFHFRIGMESTSSYKELDEHSKKELKLLYIDYFYHRQDELWRNEALKKLPNLKRKTNMLVFGEDLGMVPHCVPELMKQLGILSLEIQRMPKKADTEFFHPNDAPYLSVVTPSTHDMSTIRGWWEENAGVTQRYYNNIMGQAGNAPVYCEPGLNKEIVLQHLYSPAMWAVFQLQDLLGMNAELRRKDPHEERINDPADNNHIWNYRMHINLEDLIKENAFSTELGGYITASGR